MPDSRPLARISGWGVLCFAQAAFIGALCWMLASRPDPIVIESCQTVHPNAERKP